MSVKKITAYETTDGFISRNKEEALDRQNELDLKECVENWVKFWAYSGMSKSDVAGLVVENIDDLINELIRIGVIKG
jgi:hypothetical protein